MEPTIVLHYCYPLPAVFLPTVFFGRTLPPVRLLPVLSPCFAAATIDTVVCSVFIDDTGIFDTWAIRFCGFFVTIHCDTPATVMEPGG